MEMKYILIKELADGRKRETPIANIDWVLIKFKEELVKLKYKEKISVTLNDATNSEIPNVSGTYADLEKLRRGRSKH